MGGVPGLRSAEPLFPASERNALLTDPDVSWPEKRAREKDGYEESVDAEDAAGELDEALRNGKDMREVEDGVRAGEHDGVRRSAHVCLVCACRIRAAGRNG